MNACSNCGKVLKNKSAKYCSNKCQSDQSYVRYINDWKQGKATGQRGSNAKNISGHVIRYLHDKYSNSCSQCGWNVPNPTTGAPMLEIDHIDGDADNNIETNLTLLCPNCHSLTSTYKNLNYGRGRVWRRDKYVKIV